MHPRTFRLFRHLIHKETGIWLRDNKEVMLASRLSRRLRHLSIARFEEYYAYLENLGDQRAEIVELINCVTTNKTSFFRESHHFDFLIENTVKRLRAASAESSEHVIRVWSAACSTGEEPYSIVISLLEALQSAHVQGHGVRAPNPQSRLEPRSSDLRKAWGLQVIASDIDTGVIETARRGIYDRRNLDSLPETLMKKYFLRGKEESLGQIRVKREVAECVELKRINLMDETWPISKHLDAIFFRNALIYFKPDIQEKFLRKMVTYLKPGGYLFLGHSENVPWLHDVVAPLTNTVYQRRVKVSNADPAMPCRSVAEL